MPQSEGKARLAALCDLVERGGDILSRYDLDSWPGLDADRLMAAGLIRQVGHPEEIVCEACDEGHLAEVEWDARTGRRIAYCPEAGLVEVSRKALTAYELRRSWLAERLATALGTTDSRTAPLEDGRAWYLGTVATSGVDWNALLVRDGLDGRLVSMTKALPMAQLTVVIGLREELPEQLWIDRRIWCLRLRDIASLGSSGDLQVDRRELGRRIKGFGDGREAPPASRRGRPSVREQVVEIARARKSEGKTLGSYRAEAAEIHEVWSTFFPEDPRAPPSTGAIRRHLSATSL